VSGGGGKDGGDGGGDGCGHGYTSRLAGGGRGDGRGRGGGGAVRAQAVLSFHPVDTEMCRQDWNEGGRKVRCGTFGCSTGVV